MAGTARPHPRNKDCQGYVFLVTPSATLKAMTNGPLALAAFYGNTCSSPAPEHTWNRQRQEPHQLPGPCFPSPCSPPPVTLSDSEFRTDKQKQAQNREPAQCRQMCQLLPRHKRGCFKRRPCPPTLTTHCPALLPSPETRENRGEASQSGSHPGEEQALEKEGETASGNTVALTL